MEESIAYYRKWEYVLNGNRLSLVENPNYAPTSEFTFKLGKTDIWAGTIAGGYLKSLLIFDRRLTDEEIEYVEKTLLD